MGFSQNIQAILTRQWQAVNDILLKEKEQAPQSSSEEELAALAARNAPVVWLLGKVQSGKTSIVRALTGASDAEIGEGFRACTRTARVFDFPAEAPVLRFLDTRGLGERGYDPALDIGFHEDEAHLLLVVMKALDPQQDAILDVVRAAREKHPDWPIVVAQTTLHEAYGPGAGHIEPYPFDAGSAELGNHMLRVPSDLSRALTYQRTLFAGLKESAPIRFVAIDFTKEGDGYSPQYYGLDALLCALEDAAPAGLVAALSQERGGNTQSLSAKAHPHILGYATAAAAADAIPGAGAVAVPVIQAKLLQTLAGIYDVDWNKQTFAEFGTGLGVSTLSRMFASFGARQLMKFIPVYGQTAGAAAAAVTSFTTTFAIGKAACYFLGKRRAGQMGSDGVAEVYKKALTEAFKLFKQKRMTP